MKRKNIFTDEERYWMTGGNTGTLPTRIIPSVIYSLAPNEIFVFGSNALGMHHAGAADLLLSVVKYGTIMRVSIVQSLPS